MDARADPNITLDDDVSPLMKILTFAHKNYVGAMRDLLLRAGAVENDEIKERWKSGVAPMLVRSLGCATFIATRVKIL